MKIKCILPSGIIFYKINKMLYVLEAPRATITNDHTRSLNDRNLFPYSSGDWGCGVEVAGGPACTEDFTVSAPLAFPSFRWLSATWHPMVCRRISPSSLLCRHVNAFPPGVSARPSETDTSHRGVRHASTQCALPVTNYMGKGPLSDEGHSLRF